MAVDTPWTPQPGEILTVGEFVGRARELLEQSFGTVWIEGEIGSTRVPASGHAYFTLSDARAQLRAVCFRSTLRLLGMPPEDGLHVLVRGRLTVYEARGDLQLLVEDLEPQGEGLLRLQFEALKRRLAEEGLFSEERKRPLPPIPRSVGVVTSPSGAAVRDVLQVLRRRAPGTHVLVAPARVQGEGAAEELRAALALAASHPEVDVIILARGGGSAEDLWAFNDEGLVRDVAACAVPVIAGVGHEIDFTLVDFAADARAPTPSAAAELAVLEWARWADRLARAVEALVSVYRRRTTELRRRLERSDPERCSPLNRIARLRIGLDRAIDGLETRVMRGLLGSRERLRACETSMVGGSPGRRLGASRARLDRLVERLVSGAEGGLQRRRRILSVRAAQVAAMSPLAVLERGYAIARGPSGEVLRSAGACQPGDALDVRLARGSLGCRVTEVRVGVSDGNET